MPLIESNGIRRYYEEYGTGDPLLLLMGIKSRLRPEEFATHIQLLIFAKPYWDRDTGFAALLEGRKDAAADVMAQPLHGFEGQASACVTHDTLNQLQSIRFPCLIIARRSDIFTPVGMAKEVAAGIPHSDLHLYEVAGHAFHWECIETSTRGCEHGSARTEVFRISPLESGLVFCASLSFGLASALALSAIIFTGIVPEELCGLPRRGCSRFGKSAWPRHESAGSGANTRAVERIPCTGQYCRRHAFVRRSLRQRSGGAREVSTPPECGDHCSATRLHTARAKNHLGAAKAGRLVDL